MSTDKSVAIGVELAGRGASVALVDRRGRVRHRCNAKTLHGRPATATLEPYLRAIESMRACADAEGLRICGLGVCVPGSLDITARRPLLMALRSVRVTACWPTTSSKRCGRHLRAITW